MAEIGTVGGNPIGVRPADLRGMLNEDLSRRVAQARPAPVSGGGTASSARGLAILQERSAQGVTARKQAVQRSPVRPQEIAPAEVKGATSDAARVAPTATDRLRSGSRSGYSKVVGGVLDVQG
ncbi:MAG: hypothetical protein HY608_00360 [Planctomycetes bacterium]|nr:hypothetical protein [Planctomycetota bacterium]